MKDWLQSLDPRERAIVLGGAAVLLIVLIWVLILGPLFGGAKQQRQRVQQLQADVEQARLLRAEIGGLSGQQAGVSVAGQGQSLMLLLERTARESGLQVNQSRPMDDAVRVRFESASFEALVQWIGTLATRYGVQIDVASLDRNQTPGMVDAQITFKRS